MEHSNNLSNSRLIKVVLKSQFGRVEFCGGIKTLRARMRTNSKLNSHMASTLGIKPGSHCVAVMAHKGEI